MIVVVVSASALYLAERALQRADRRAVAAPVLPGIDVLLADSAHLIAGKRLGLITNATGVDAAGVLTVDRLWAAAESSASRLVALFAPEHGLSVTLRPGETFADTIDGRTGLPIYSVYGPARAPTPAQFAQLDVLVIDVQDVGARPFTYISTAIHSLRAAAAAGKRVLLLDRPNPVGCAVQGPVLDTAHASFIGMLAVPLRHGMTLGELARFANAELAIGADLVVVPVSGWDRCAWFEDTRLPFVPPSPNLPAMASIEWYPGTVLLEATNLSVGRGSDAPFRQVGAPWLDAGRVAAEAARRGVLVDPVRFTPRQPGDAKYDGQALSGVRLRALERRGGDPVATALLLLDAVAAVHPDSLRIDTAGMDIRLGVRRAPSQTTWPADVAAHRRRVARHLIY